MLKNSVRSGIFIEATYFNIFVYLKHFLRYIKTYLPWLGASPDAMNSFFPVIFIHHAVRISFSFSHPLSLSSVYVVNIKRRRYSLFFSPFDNGVGGAL